MVKKIALIAASLFCFVLLLMYIFQRNLMYLPVRQIPSPKKFQAEDMTIVSLRTTDHIELNAWYKPAQNNKPTILYLHGNGGNIGQRMPLNRQFINAGLGVLLLDYRGYGGNKGSPTETGIYEDARTAIRFLEEQGVKPQQLVLYGESLGTGVATKMANEYRTCAIILQSPYTSMVKVAHFHYPWIIIEPWDKFDSLSRIKTINSPLLVLHGKQDQVVPYSEGLALYKAAVQPKKMLSYEDRTHHNMWNGQGYVSAVLTFINSHCDQQENK